MPNRIRVSGGARTVTFSALGCDCFVRRFTDVGHDRYGATLSGKSGSIKEACLEEVATQVLKRLEREKEQQQSTGE